MSSRIVLVNDIDWLGGQFSAEGVGCVDEWTTVRGKRVDFPRSGLFLEVMQRIRAHNSQKIGIATLGNAFCGTDTIEPAAEATVEWGTLHRWLTALKLPANTGLARQKDLPLTRVELAIHLWAILKPQREWLPDLANYLKPGNDLDGDGVPDLEDGLPLSKRF